MLYGIKYFTDLAADIIIQKDDDTYACNFDPTKIDHSENAPDLEAQPIWQITCIRSSVLLENNTQISRTQTLYPFGSQHFCYKVSELFNYEYCYRL